MISNSSHTQGINLPPRFQKDCLTTWLSLYAANTPGVEALADVSVQLDQDSEIHLDGLLRIKQNVGGQSKCSGDRVIGAPEFGAKIIESSPTLTKPREYMEKGFLEFFEWAPNAKLGGGIYSSFPPPEYANSDSCLFSRIFPGLVVELSSYYNCDIRVIAADIRKFTNTPEHNNFVGNLMSGSWSHTSFGDDINVDT